VVERQVDWKGPRLASSNQRFTHPDHWTAFAHRRGADSSLACATCHIPAKAAWMTVVRTQAATCLTCHGVTSDHFNAPDTACATCHLTLAEAPRLTEARIAAFPAPSSHQSPDFMGSRGHGVLGRPAHGAGGGIAACCATCHARDFCASCHVNARRVPLIQALAPDQRSLAIPAELHAPATHAEADFLARHGPAVRRDPARCATCHTQESCVACHQSQPGVAATLLAAAPGQATGAKVIRRRPENHAASFTETHAAAASSRPRTCAACHARSECLDCHRPAAGTSGGYHRAGFLTSHPAAAYNRQSDCAECHNTQQFCSDCHRQSGLTAKRPLQAGYHDGNPSFLLQHGPTARRELEKCVTCHTERDCLACHSSQTRRFNPHGPGFDADRLRRRNPQTCSACHGQNIPGG
jgi:hypothetical protein